MSFNQDIYKAAKEIEKAAKTLENSEEFILMPLTVKMVKAAEAYPEDQTIKQMAAFLNNRSHKKAIFITRGELRDVYKALYTRNTKCADLMSDELGKADALPEPQKMIRDKDEGSIIAEAFNNLGNPALANALSAAFEGKDVSFENYSAPIARQAERNCAIELDKIGADAHKITTVAGKEDILICQATYETPKGQSSVLIPVEVVNGRALLPSVFLSRSGFQDLEGDALTNHLINTAGKKWKIDVQQLLKVLSKAKAGPTKEISEVEAIVAKFAAQQGTPANHSSDALLYQEVDKEHIEVQLPEAEDTQKFAEKLHTAKGAAEFTFGKKAIDAGRTMLRNIMASYGYNNIQIAVADTDNDKVCFAVAIDNGAGFKVPVKISGGLPVEPSVIIANGSIAEFSQKGVSKTLIENKDYESAALASQLHGVKPSELIETVRKAMTDGNYNKAEEALNVLSQTDQKAFHYAFGMYQSVLSGNTINKLAAEDTSKCLRQVKHAHSKHVICGHTGLPLHKVCQDEHGDCQPLYRKDLKNTNEGGSFLHSRIYLG
jgi:hypothetical protein